MSFKNYLGVNYEHSTKEELVELCKAMTIAEDLSGAEVDTLRKLWDNGPLEVRDVPSKQGLRDLIDRGLVSQWSNQKGNYCGVVTGLGGTVYRALNYLGNIQSLPILLSPVVAGFQNDVIPHTASEHAGEVDQKPSYPDELKHNDVKLLDRIKINRQLAEKQKKSEERQIRGGSVDGKEYLFEELWCEDKDNPISYLNLVTVMDVFLFVEWLNSRRRQPAVPDNILVDLGIWSIIYPNTKHADYRLGDIGQRFKNGLVAKTIIVDLGQSCDNPNARYRLSVQASGDIEPQHTLLEHLNTFK